MRKVMHRVMFFVVFSLFFTKGMCMSYPLIKKKIEYNNLFFEREGIFNPLHYSSDRDKQRARALKMKLSSLRGELEDMLSADRGALYVERFFKVFECIQKAYLAARVKLWLGRAFDGKTVRNFDERIVLLKFLESVIDQLQSQAPDNKDVTRYLTDCAPEKPRFFNKDLFGLHVYVMPKSHHALGRLYSYLHTTCFFERHIIPPLGRWTASTYPWDQKPLVGAILDFYKKLLVIYEQGKDGLEKKIDEMCAMIEELS